MTEQASAIRDQDLIPNDMSVEDGWSDGTMLIVSESEPDAIAELPYYGEAYEAKRRALANLFAASPALLAVVEAMLAEHPCGITRCDNPCCVAEGARAALSRARGATPPDGRSPIPDPSPPEATS